MGLHCKEKKKKREGGVPVEIINNKRLLSKE
jgi:hypothetical protein